MGAVKAMRTLDVDTTGKKYVEGVCAFEMSSMVAVESSLNVRVAVLTLRAEVSEPVMSIPLMVYVWSKLSSM